MSFVQAQDICEEHGSSLASYEQLISAQNEGILFSLLNKHCQIDVTLS